MPVTQPRLGVVIAALTAGLAAPAAARAQFVDRSVVVDGGEAPAPTPAAPAASASGERLSAEPDEASRLELRLTLSSFLYRESGDDAAPLVDGGEPLDDASPVRRFFGDLRLELGVDRLGGGDAGLRFDGRVRQTTSERYQAGASAGAEYELRTLAYRHRLGATELRLGRQLVEEVGATRIDGAAALQRLSGSWTAILFGGAYPRRGSRSLDTDYPAIRRDDGTTGAPLVPLAAGAGVSYRTAALHGDVGVGGILATQEVSGVERAAAHRGFATASGYWRPAPAFALYHHAVLDVVGPVGVQLTSGNLGIDAFPLPSLQLSASIDHVDSELLEIAARNLLAEPDPAAMGVVQNEAVLVRVAQDQARLGASLALGHGRFQLSASASLDRRPAIEVPLEDGSAVSFPEATMAHARMALVDRRAPGGLRVELSADLLAPVGDDPPTRSRGAMGRLAVGRTSDRGGLEVDVMVQRFRDLGPSGGCPGLDPLACYGTATSRAAQAGILASLRAGRDWLVLLDGHVGVRDAESTTAGASVSWPRVLSLAAFARLQWRYE
jgi:hypothetical protein